MEQEKIIKEEPLQFVGSNDEAILNTLRNINYELRGITQKIKNIEDRQEAIWKDVNTLISRPVKEYYSKSGE